eukprot:3429500-Rhodomonas_salina.1
MVPVSPKTAHSVLVSAARWLILSRSLRQSCIAVAFPCAVASCQTHPSPVSAAYSHPASSAGNLRICPSRAPTKATDPHAIIVSLTRCD